jgi:PAS domain-containing protein
MIHSIFFFALCGLAIYLSYDRAATKRKLAQTRTILRRLPAPVILSDASGVIVYANDAVTPILHHSSTEIVGRSYFDFVLMDKLKGQAIRSYFDRFEADTNGVFQLEISPFGEANRGTAELICLGKGANRVMITVLPKIERILEQPVLPQG